MRAAARSALRTRMACRQPAARHLSAAGPSPGHAFFGTSSSDSDAPVKSGSVNGTVEVAIIGGGVIGSSILYHLAQAGVTDAALFEKTELTAGSTWHAAGLTTYFNPGANAKNFHYDSLNLYKRLEEETGLQTSFHEVGSIRLIDTQERLDEALYQMGMSELWPAEYQLITPEQAGEMHPLLETHDLKACIYNPGDGHIDPTSVTNVLIAAAKSRGAKVHRYTPVEGLTQLDDGRWEVHTARGTVTANTVFNCGGLWAKEVARMAGVTLPLVTIEHQYVITGPVPEVESLKEEHGMKELPVIRDLYGSYYLRQERNGILIGPYEPEKDMKLREGWQKDGMPNDFGMELFEGDLDRIMPHLEIAMERVPAAINGGIKDVINGPVSWSPDGQPIVGPQPGKKNFWNACAFSYGIVHGGGAGKYIVDWLLNGEPSYELFEFDTARYGEWATPAYTRAKVRESYGWNNVIVTPDLERPAGRPCRTSGVYDLLAAKGAHFTVHNGWEIPKFFDIPGEGRMPDKPSFRRTNWHRAVARECELVENHAGIIDITAFSKFQISGPGAEDFLHSLCANKMPALGRTSIVHMLTPQAKMLAELTISRTAPDSFYVVTGSEMERHDMRWFEQHMPTDGSVSIENLTRSMAVLGVAGPKSRQILQRLTFENLDDEEFKFLDARQIDIGPCNMLAMRISFTGELGWELHMPIDAQRAVYTAIMEAGAEDGIGDFGGLALNSFRLEKGFRLLGSDMTKDHTALETGMVPRFIRLKVHDYIGRSAIVEQRENGGAATKFVYMTVEADDADCQGNEPLYEVGGTEVVGFTTTGGFGHATQKSIAFGYANKGLAVPGTELETVILGERRKVLVTDGPLAETEPTRTRNAKLAAAAAAEA